MWTWEIVFVIPCLVAITALHVHWLKGRICRSVFLGHHFFTCTLIEREIVFCHPGNCFCHPLSLSHPFFTCTLIKREIVFVIQCLSVITSFFFNTLIERENGFVILHLCHPFFISAVTEGKNMCHTLSLRHHSFIIICIYRLGKKEAIIHCFAITCVGAGGNGERLCQ